MVGVKGKSGRHKKDCSCERCSKKRVDFFAEKPKIEEPKEEVKIEC